MSSQPDFEIPTPRYRPTAVELEPPSATRLATEGAPLSWPAVASGTVIALAIALLLNVLGVAVGMRPLAPSHGAQSATEAFGMVGAVWWIVSGVLAMVAGAWVAAKLAARAQRQTGVFHGLVTWAVVTLLTYLIIGTVAGRMIGGPLVILAMEPPTAFAPGQVDPSVATSGTLAKIESELRILTGTNQTNAATAQQLSMLLEAAMAERATPESQQALIDLLIKQAGFSAVDAQTQLASWRADLWQAATPTTSTAALPSPSPAILSRVALFAFLALAVGAVAATVGGRLAAPRD